MRAERMFLTMWGALMMTAYVPFWNNGISAPRWIVLMTGAAVFSMLAVSRPAPGAGTFSLLTFGVWAILSVLWSDYFFDSVVALTGTWFVILIFFLGRTQTDLRPLFVGLGVGMAVNVMAIAFQKFGAWPFYEFSSPAGLFSNRSVLSELAAVVLIGAVGYKLWWVAAISLPVIALSGSRAAVISIFAAGVCFLFHRFRTPLCRGALSVALVFVVIGAAIGFKPSSSWDRFAIVKDATNSITVVGQGIGTFAQNFPLVSSRHTLETRPVHAHMDFVEFAHDLGLIGLGLLLFFVSVVFSQATVRDRCILTVIVTEACLGLHPLFLPSSLLVAAMVAGCATRSEPAPVWDAGRVRNFGVPRMEKRGHESASAGA